MLIGDYGHKARNRIEITKKAHRTNSTNMLTAINTKNNAYS